MLIIVFHLQIEFLCTHSAFCDVLNIPAINEKNERTKPSSANLAKPVYEDIVANIKTVGGFPVAYVPMEKPVSRPRQLEFETLRFNMGVLGLSAKIYGVYHTIEEADRQSFEVFIETLYEWLPTLFLGNSYLLSDDSKEVLVSL